MKKLLFKLHNTVVAMEGVLDEFEISDASYSCLWDVYKCSAGGDDYVQIDTQSVRRQVFRNGEFRWVVDQVPANVIASLEEKLQDEIDGEVIRVNRLNREREVA